MNVTMTTIYHYLCHATGFPFRFAPRNNAPDSSFVLISVSGEECNCVTVSMCCTSPSARRGAGHWTPSLPGPKTIWRPKMWFILCLERHPVQGASLSSMVMCIAIFAMIYTLLCMLERPNDHKNRKRRSSGRRRFERGSPKLFVPQLPWLTRRIRSSSQGSGHDISITCLIQPVLQFIITCSIIVICLLCLSSLA